MRRSFCIVACAFNHQLRRVWYGWTDSILILSMSPLITAAAAATAAILDESNVVMEAIACGSCDNRSSFTPETIHTHKLILVFLFPFSFVRSNSRVDCGNCSFWACPQIMNRSIGNFHWHDILTIVFVFVVIIHAAQERHKMSAVYNRFIVFALVFCLQFVHGNCYYY